MLPEILHRAGSPWLDGADGKRGWPDDPGTMASWLLRLEADPQRVLAAVHGGFALAVRLRNGHVLVATDRFGQETLCWRVDGSNVLVSGRADAVAAKGADIDHQAIFDYLYFHAIPSPRTVFAGVARLTPASYGHFDGARMEVRPYWVPRFEPRSDLDFGPCRDRFRDLVSRAVSRRLHDEEPVACFLSGGTDSSTVAGMAARAGRRKVLSFSIGFDAQGYDEMAYARLAARHFGTEHHEYYVTPDDLVRDIPRMAAHFDQPFGNSSVLPAYLCARVAHEHGVRTMLAGDGGDELFGGNSRYAKQRVFDAYQFIPGFLSKGVLEPMLMASPLGSLPLLRKGRSYVEQARVPMPDRLQLYNLLQRQGVDVVLDQPLRARVDLGEPLEHQRRTWREAHADNVLDRTLAFDWRYTLAESDLPKVRLATSLANVRVEYPLLDDELLAFSMQLPPSWKLKGLKLRWFFKAALTGFLPDEIINKSKHGFGLPFGVWAQNHGALRELATESLRALAGRGYIQRSYVDELLGRRLAEHPGYFGEMVWILMMLEQWLKAQERPRP